MKLKKIKKFLKSPPIFFKDYLNKKYPVIRNEILCPKEEEEILIKHDALLLNSLNNDIVVDIVYTWVDDSDKEWQRKKAYYQNKNELSLGNYATDEARFKNHDELYYSLKSVEKNIPWVRNIYIVTDNQKPKWLDLKENKNIFIVDHKEIIDSTFLPTFNSHVIEANLHKIPNLSENFIYFNDDVFVARNLDKNHFIESNGLSSLFISKKSLKSMERKGVITPTLSASLKCQSILYEKYGHYIDTPLVHTYVPLKKEFFVNAWKEFGDDINGFLKNKFRTNNDLNLATFLVPWLAYINSKASIKRDICYYFNIRSKSARSYYQALRKAKKEGNLPHSFCANDFNTHGYIVDNYGFHLQEELEIHFDSREENVKKKI